MHFQRVFSRSVKLRCLYHRAVVHTGAAAGAKVFDNASSPFADFYFKITGFTADLFKIRVGNKLDIQMPADLDQYG